MLRHFWYLKVWFLTFISDWQTVACAEFILARAEKIWGGAEKKLGGADSRPKGAKKFSAPPAEFDSAPGAELTRGEGGRKPHYT